MLENVSGRVFVAYDRKAGNLVLREGETIMVRVGERLNDGNFRVSVRGVGLTARMLANVEPHTTVPVRVQVQENRLALVPIADAQATQASQDFSQQLGANSFAQPELAHAIVQNLSEMYGTVDPNRLSQIYNASLSFVEDIVKEHQNQKEGALLKDAAFLHAVLLDKKLLLSFSQKKELFKKLFPLDSDTENEETATDKQKSKRQAQEPLDKSHTVQDQKSRLGHETNELLALVNHTKGRGNFTWVIVPFERADLSLRGMVGFLLEVESANLKKCVMRAKCGRERFVFELGNDYCDFFIENQAFSKEEQAVLIAELNKEFSNYLLKMDVRYSAQSLDAKSINLEV